MSNILSLLIALAVAGPPAGPVVDEPPVADSFRPDAAWKPLGKDVWFDPKEKRLVVRARVALQDGVLEHLLCKKGTKEHESILATEAPAKLIHAGLILTGAEAGHPVRFDPKFEPPAGTAILIEVEWGPAGKTRKVDAREWVKDQVADAPLARDWVFAGSELLDDPRTQAKFYAADDGDLITVANFPASILDLPYRSSANDGERGYSARADRVPARGTPVTIYLRPRPAPAPAPSQEQAQPKAKAGS